MFFHKRTPEEIAKAGGPTPSKEISGLKWFLISIGLLFIGGVGAIALESKLSHRKTRKK
jgi:hypothetical protein